jgi:hypothetical protein
MSLRSRGVGYVRVQSGGNTPLVSGGLAEHSNIGYELRDMASLQSGMLTGPHCQAYCKLIYFRSYSGTDAPCQPYSPRHREHAE